MEVFGLANLALMASPSVPFDVVVKEGPPESDEDITGSSKNPFVSEIVVCKLDDRKAIGNSRNLLRTTVWALLEHLPI